jgi:hypothetical protein
VHSAQCKDEEIIELGQTVELPLSLDHFLHDSFDGQKQFLIIRHVEGIR